MTMPRPRWRFRYGASAGRPIASPFASNPPPHGCRSGLPRGGGVVAIPVGPRRVVGEAADALDVGLAQADQAEPLAMRPADLHHLERPGPVLLAVADERGAPAILQRFELGGVGGLAAS